MGMEFGIARLLAREKAVRVCAWGRVKTVRVTTKMEKLITANFFDELEMKRNEIEAMRRAKRVIAQKSRRGKMALVRLFMSWRVLLMSKVLLYGIQIQVR